MSRSIATVARLSVLTLACGLLGACDVPEVLQDYELLEEPANQDIEPTGQPCDTRGAAAACLDEMSVSFCGAPVTGGVSEYGECMLPEEVTCTPGETRESGWCGGTSTCTTNEAGEPVWGPDYCGEPPTPLVLRFDSAPITMIAAEQTPAATFDIEMAADGSSCISTDWPSAATPWLAIDLDGSGAIEGGHELFGSGTRLDAGAQASNGFEALAPYDSNRDGQIDAKDDDFGRLLVWRDYDADRLSSPDELETLAAAGVDSLALGYVNDAQCDERGNCGIERSAFSHAGGRGELVDLHLPCR